MARITIFQHTKDAVGYGAGQVVFNQGDQAEQMYVVIQGAIDIVANGNVVATAGPGEAFGEMALIENMPRSATAVAQVDSQVLPLDRRRFLFMVSETPNFALQLMAMMAERLRASNDRLVG
jgi:CRP-like cAMP-binding protein